LSILGGNVIANSNPTEEYGASGIGTGADELEREYERDRHTETVAFWVSILVHWRSDATGTRRMELLRFRSPVFIDRVSPDSGLL
jgi:hypothetical protein